MRGRFAPYITGVGLTGLAGVMLFFSGYALILGEPYLNFVATAAAAGIIGLILVKVGTAEAEPARREALLGVLLLWFLVPLFGAIPYWISGGLTPLNAFFESMSGFTTTGATVLIDFANFPRSLFMWRALTQWLGGVGIIVLFIAVFPQLAIAGRQLFFAEAPGPTEDLFTPRLRHTARAVLTVYVGLTVLCMLGYLLVGMSLYNAVAHALTTLAAGGFSPNGLSFEGFSPAAQWIAIVFMVFAGLNFALQYRAFVLQHPRELLRDAEFRAYLGIVTFATVFLFFMLQGVYPVAAALRHGLFQVLSILTTTGYASTDFAAWPERAQVVLLLLMFVGGSAGSAAGGIKVVRWLIISSFTARGLRQALYPRAVQRVWVGGRVVPDDVVQAVAVFITLYVALFVVSTSTLVVLGEDFVTAFSAAIACIGNIGPGLAGVGPMGNFADLHAVSRALLIFDMYAGRLEIITVFVMLDPDWWRLPRVNLFRRTE